MTCTAARAFTSSIASLILLGALGSASARAAPSEVCPGTCAGTSAPCGGDADCDVGTRCDFVDACLPGLARLVAKVVPEGPGGLNDSASGWTCGLIDCAPNVAHLSFKSDYGITAVATKDISLEPGKRYLAVAEMRADAGSWGYFDIAAADVGGTSDRIVSSEWKRVTAFFTVPATHRGSIQFRLHADGPGYIAIRQIALLELRDYGVFLRFSLLAPALPTRFSAGFILRHAGDGPGYYPGACADGEPVTPACVEADLMSVDALAGAPSPWIEVSRMFGPAPGGWRVTIPWHLSDPLDGAPIVRARVSVEVAFAPEPEAVVWSETRALPDDRIGLVLPEGVPHPLDLTTTPGFVADGVARDRASFTPANARASAFKIGTSVNTIDLFDAPSAVASDGLALQSELGLNAVEYLTDLPSPAERAKAVELGLVNRFIHAEHLLAAGAYSEIDFDRAAIKAMVEAGLDDPYWARELGEAAAAGTRFAILGDEIGGLALAGPEYRAAYVDWLEEQGVGADELGLARLSEALPLESFGWWNIPEVRPDPALDPAAARRYVYALRFWNEATAETYGIARKALSDRFGEVPAAHNSGTPLAGLYYQLSLGSDFQAMARHRALSGFFGEGFLSYQDDCLAWQLGLYADYAAGITAPWREAASARGELFPLASHLHAYRGDSGAKMLELAARGFDWFNHYSYGPYDLSTGDGAGGLGELSRGWLQRVRDGSELLARAEPWLHGARRAPAQIVMLASQADSVWSDEDGLTAEEIGWHIALTQAHHPVDFMLEDEIAQGLLGNPLVTREVLIVMRKHVTVAAWKAIERWVDGGGTLILGGELATHDEFGVYDQARAEWALFFTDEGSAGGSETIRWASSRGVASFGYQGPWSELVSIVGTPIGFSDDSHAVALRIPRGRGRIYALGVALGASYRLPETSCDGSRPPELAQRPSGFSAVMREVMSDLVETAGVVVPVRADAPNVSLQRLVSASGDPFVLAIPWSNGPVSLALTIPELARCDRVTEVLGDVELPVSFGAVLATLEGPAIFTWDRADCAPIVPPDSRPEVVEPSPGGASDEGCGGARGADLLAACCVLLWAAARKARPAQGLHRAPLVR